MDPYPHRPVRKDNDDGGDKDGAEQFDLPCLKMLTVIEQGGETC